MSKTGARKWVFRYSWRGKVTEAALAHVIGDKAEQAYRRSDALEKRRELMTAWANHCERKAGSNVVSLRGVKAKC